MMVRRLLFALVFASTTVIGAAEAASFCMLVDEPDTSSVIPWSNPDPEAKVTIDLEFRDVVELGDEGSEDFVAGAVIVDTTTARTRGAVWVSHVGTSPHVHIEAAGQRTVRSLPQRDLALGWSSARIILPVEFPSGDYHVVGLTMGGGNGASLDGLDDRTEVHVEISATGLTACDPLAARSTLHHFNERDFRGTHIAVPGGGIRQQTSLTYDNPDTFLVGLMHHEAAFESTFDIDTPTGGGRIPYDSAPISSFSGRYTFFADQIGVPARISINALTYSPTT